MTRRLWSEQVRVTFWAWVATLCAAGMLAPLTVAKGYLMVGGLGAALVAITGAVLRARRAHLLLVLVAEVAVAFEWMVVTFASGEAKLGFLPGPDAISELQRRWSDYADFANRYAAPLPADENVTMAMAMVLVALGIVVDIVAASWRRAALLGLVFLAVYMTPVSILGGEISLFAFLVGALGYVFLLAADERERLTHWGRQISTAGSLWDRPSEVDEGGLRRNGTRVGLGAIALAAVLPVLVPTLSPHYFGQTGSGGSGGSGDGTVTVDSDPELDLRRGLLDQTPGVLMRVRTDEIEPSYFQLAVLDEFDGEVWTVSERSEDDSVPVGEDLPLPPDLDVSTLTTPHSYEVSIDEDFDTSWLPLRYIPTTITIDQDNWRIFREQLDASNDPDTTAAGQTYSFTAELVEPQDWQLRGAEAPPPELLPYLDLPSDLPGEFAAVAESVTEDEEAMFDQAKAIETYFRSDAFDYSLDQIGTGDRNVDDLVDFLVDSKVGYCEQYAASMAIMARTLEIPSRVVIGFLEPELGEDGAWEYRGTDMHAWPELYFEGAGWVRFEPTPDTDESEGAVPPDFSGGPTSTVTGGGTEPTNTLPSREPTAGPRTGAPGTDAEDDAAGGGISSIWWGGPLVVFGLALLASLPRLSRAAIRRRRWAQADGPVAAAEAAWIELRDDVLDLRMEWDAGATPRAIGRSLRERLPDDRASGGAVVPALNRLVLAIEQGRYARSIRDADGLRAAQVTVAEALASRQTRGTRFRARWLPASLLRSRRRATVRRERLGELLVSVED